MKQAGTGPSENISPPLTSEAEKTGPTDAVSGGPAEKQPAVAALAPTADPSLTSTSGVVPVKPAGGTDNEWSWALDLARAELRWQDPVMGRLIDAKPDLDYHAWRAALPVASLLEALLYQIVGQQISVSAANAIYARLRALFIGCQSEPALLAQISIDELRGIGLSARKAEYVRDLARRAADGELEGVAELSHEEARQRLVSFRGIGPWTADGALLIAFGWPDVLVAGDLVLRKAVQRAYGFSELPSEKEVEALGERWRPHRSLAAGYLFESMSSV